LNYLPATFCCFNPKEMGYLKSFLKIQSMSLNSEAVESNFPVFNLKRKKYFSDFSCGKNESMQKYILFHNAFGRLPTSGLWVGDIQNAHPVYPGIFKYTKGHG